MCYFRRSLTIIMMLLTSWMLIVSNAAIADVGASSMHEQNIQTSSFCGDDTCTVDSEINCLQHCDSQSVIPLSLPSEPNDHLITENVVIDDFFLLNLILQVELKPPQSSFYR